MRIDDKIHELRTYLQELDSIKPTTLDAYIHDLKAKAACERYFEKIIGAAVDLAFLILKENGLRMPQDDKQAFDILANGKIITLDLAERLKNAKGMRNLLAHKYGEVDDDVVFHSITEEIGRDIRELLRHAD